MKCLPFLHTVNCNRCKCSHIDGSLTKYLLVKAGSVKICGTGSPCSLPNRYSPSKCRSQPKIKKNKKLHIYLSQKKQEQNVPLCLQGVLNIIL